MKNYHFTTILIIIAGFVFYAFGQQQQRHRHRHHMQKSADNETGGALPTGYNDLFAGSGECLLCHNSQVNQQGQSVSIIADWRSSMMANSAKDPFWQAKVSHEGLVNPPHKEILEDVCTRCHAPVGNFNAHHNGQALYSADEMRADPLALDGAQCTMCHQIKESSLGNFSGQVEVGEDKKIWGPFTNPFTNPMISHTGYTPTYGNHIRDARLCGSCHTLITNTVDMNGVLTGGEFVEQAIYHEWKNSDYASNGQVCQDCHVPRIDDPVNISSMPPWLDPRSPFGMHQLAGANVFMTRLLKDNGGQIGITATTAQLDSTMDRSTRMLQQQSLNLFLTEDNRTADTIFTTLLLQNKTGHKFPTGYPARRVFVEVLALDENGDTLFHSGKTDADFNLIAEDESYENHHSIINSDAQVQIYELVMGNVEGDVTTVLQRADAPLKDNRIPPAGFSTSYYSYDTTQIVGAAQDDSDFNYESGNEGSGTDRIYYHIPSFGYGGAVQISAKVFYQSVNDKWLEHMFSYSSTQIDAFKSYYDGADKTPVMVGAGNLTSVPLTISEPSNDKVIVFPNPASDKICLHFGSVGIKHISVYDLSGKLLGGHIVAEGQDGFTIDAKGMQGIILVKTEVNNSSSVITKVLVH